MHKRSSVLASALLIPLGLGLVAEAGPADVPAQPPPIFGESMDVRVVNVEAVVTDRQGNRVSGLKPGDFRLRVDGKSVPVDYFSEVKEGRVLAPAAAEPGDEKSPPQAPVQQVAEGKVGTYYLVYVDDYFVVGPQRDLVLKGLKADLAKLNPEDRMAIVAYDGGRLAMISNWSGSAADLGAALDRAAQRKAHGFERRTEGRSFASDQSFAGQTVAAGNPLDLNQRAPGLTGTQSAYGSQLIAQIGADVQAAVSALRAFAAPPGRKVMLLLSGGWPFSVQSYITGGTGMPTHELPEGDKVLAPLTRTANLLGYTLYPVDVPGVQTLGADAEATAPGGGGGSGNEQEVEGSLYFLAQQTGGKALVNSNRIAALSRASADTRSFYWLGFTPEWKRNDKPHEIKLEVARPGLRVRSRSGFLDLSHKAEVSMKVESALLFGGLPDGTSMPMKVGEIKRNRRGQLEVPLTLGLPVDLMTVVPVNGKFNAQLELRFAASNSDGSASDIPVVPVNLVSDHPPAAGKVVKYATSVTLHGKADHLVVAAYDPLSGKLASAETDVKAP